MLHLFTGFPGMRRHPHRPDASSTSGRKAAGLWGRRRRVILLCTEANPLTFQAASSSSASRQELLELALLIFWPATISLRDPPFQCNNVPANSSLSLVQETENTHTHTQTILDPLPLESNFTNLFGSFGFRQSSRELCII